MAAILTEYSNVRNAINFMDKFNGDESPTENLLYLGIGRETEWINDDNPPQPENSLSDINDFWSNAIAFQRLEFNDITLVKPRVDWESGKEFFTFDNDSGTSYYSDFYCVVPDDSNEARVWQVWTKTSSGTLTSTPPAFASASQDANGNLIDDTGDGYTWRYLYNIAVNDWRDITDKNWMPVNFDHKTTQEQQNYGVVETARVLFSRHVMARININDTDVPTGLSYRQVVLVANPKENTSGNPLFTGPVGLMSNYSNSGTDEVLQGSGDIIYLENRTPIPRTQDQSEEVKIVIRF